MALCLGIDPGLGRLGYALVESEGSAYRALVFGVIETKAGKPLPERLSFLYVTLREMVDRKRPGLLAVERLFFGRNRTTAEMIFQVRGVILLLGALNGLNVIEPTPAQVKNAVCGSGHAQKRQVQQMVQRIYGLPAIPTPDDAADALAVALAGITIKEFEDRTGGSGYNAPIS
ncbi:MAG: crossover junction endodeoxyribonuclease RuvC [Thermovirgaceae bacterium]